MKVTILGLQTGSLNVKCAEMQLPSFQRDYNWKCLNWHEFILNSLPATFASFLALG